MPLIDFVPNCSLVMPAGSCGPAPMCSAWFFPGPPCIGIWRAVLLSGLSMYRVPATGSLIMIRLCLIFPVTGVAKSTFISRRTRPSLSRYTLDCDSLRMWFPSASVVSRVTMISALSGAPLTGLISPRSPIGPPIGPGPPMNPPGCGGGGACAAATAGNRHSPNNPIIEIARITTFISTSIFLHPLVHDAHPAHHAIVSNYNVGQDRLSAVATCGSSGQFHANHLLFARADQRIAQHQRHVIFVLARIAFAITHLTRSPFRRRRTRGPPGACRFRNLGHRLRRFTLPG